MAIIGRMDKAVATAAVFSITILEGGGMVLAKYFREEGREESRAEIERVQAENQRIHAENQKVMAENQRIHAENQRVVAEKERYQSHAEALQKRLQEYEARNGNKSEEE